MGLQKLMLHFDLKQQNGHDHDHDHCFYKFLEDLDKVEMGMKNLMIHNFQSRNDDDMQNLDQMLLVLYMNEHLVQDKMMSNQYDHVD